MSSGRRGSVLVVLAVAVPLVVFLTAERRIAGTTGFPLDDTWIHLQFARNLAEGFGFSYNPGVPVAGSTAMRVCSHASCSASALSGRRMEL